MVTKRFIAVVLLLAGLSAGASQPPANDPAVAAFQGGGAMLGTAPPIGAPPMKVRWTYAASEQGRVGIDAPAVIYDGAAFVADSDGILHTLDLKTGKPRWRYITENGFATTPLVMDGRVFIGDLLGYFHAIDLATGKKAWVVDTKSSIHASANNDGQSILVGNDAGDIYCLNAADGRNIWQAKAQDRINSAPAVADGLAYFSGCDMRLRALDVKTGREKLNIELGAVAPGSPLLTGGRLVVGTDQGRVYCFDPKEGKRSWVYEGIIDQAMVYASPAVSEGVIVTGARDRRVHAIDLATGKKLWDFRTRGDVDASPVISGGRVYIPSMDKKLYVLDLKSGKMLWSFQASRSVAAGVAIGGGAVVFGDTSGTVYCLEPVMP